MQNNRDNVERNANNGSFMKLLKKIYHESGWRGFYAGVRIDLIRVLPSNAITFVVYEYTKKRLLKKKNKKL